MRKVFALVLLSTAIFAQSQQYPAPSGGGGGSGDVTDVGDCTGSACFTAAGSGTSLVFKNGTSGSVQLQTVAGALGTVTVSMPASTGTAVLTTTLYRDTDQTMKTVRDSSTQLTWGGCSATHPCNVRIGDTVYTYTNDAVISTPTGSGTLYAYVASDGTRTIGHNITGFGSCTNCTATGSVTSFPANSVPFATWTITSNAFDAAGGTDYRGAGGRDIFLAGTGLSKSGNTLSVNTAVISSYTSGTGAAPGTCTLGDRYIKTNTAQEYVCTTTNTFTEVTGGGSGTVTSVAQSFTGGLISVSGSPITTSGTLALTVAGTSGGVPYFSSSSTWASSAALGSNQIVFGGGAGAAPATSANFVVSGSGGTTPDIGAVAGANYTKCRADSGAGKSWCEMSNGSNTMRVGVSTTANSTGGFQRSTVDNLRFNLVNGEMMIGRTAGTPVSGTDLVVRNGTASAATAMGIEAGQTQSTTALLTFRDYNATPGTGTVLSTITAAGAYSGPLILLNGSSSGTVTVQPAAAAGTWSLTLPTSGGTSGYFLQTNGSGVTTWAAASGSGDVTAASAFGTDNRVIRSDGTGKGVQSTGITVDDSDNVSGAASISFGADPADAGAIRCSNNTTCMASEIATPGTDMTFGSNASNQWVASHALVAPGFISSDASNAGYFEFGQGTATSPSANSVRLYGAASIGTAWAGVLPSAIGATGFMKVSVSGAIATYSHAALVAGDLPAALSSSTSINGLGITASTGTLTIANGKTASISNTLTFTGTDSSSVAFGAGGTVLYSGGALGTPSSGTATNITGLPVGGMTIAAMSFPCNVTSSSAAGTACGFGVSPLSSKSAAYTTTITDAGALILHPTADNNARTFTIDSNANVAYPLGTCITFYNQINTVTIAITSDTLTLAGAGTTGSRTLAANGIATACKIATTSWVINGTGLT